MNTIICPNCAAGALVPSKEVVDRETGFLCPNCASTFQSVKEVNLPDNYKASSTGTKNCYTCEYFGTISAEECLLCSRNPNFIDTWR